MASCEKGVIAAEQAVQHAGKAREYADEAYGSAERSLQQAQSADVMADHAREYAEEEEQAVEMMQNWVQQAQSATDLAFSLRQAADAAQESGQRNATGACYDLNDRIQLLEEVNRADLNSAYH